MITEIIEEFEQQIKDYVSKLPEVQSSQLGLDKRCGLIFVDEESDALIVQCRNDRMLQYYGGFEYVNPECRMTVGSYVIYFGDDGRVRDALDMYTTNTTEINENDE